MPARVPARRARGDGGRRVRRVAAVDCGTNSIRLLIAERSVSGGAMIEVDRQLELVRLGQGVDANGEFHPDALQRTFAATEAYAMAINRAGVATADVRFVATSAARDAANRDDFFAGIEQRLGVLPEIISGEEEAQLSYDGAVAGIGPQAEPVLVVDIGGGSTELIVGSDGSLEQAVSLNVGSVRLRERLLNSDPPTETERANARTLVDGQLDALDLSRVQTWIGVAGTATTLAAVYLGLEAYDREAVDGCRVPVADVIALCDRVAASTVAELRAIPSMHPKRADVISGGALICAQIARRLSVAELIVSEADMLDGIAASLLDGQ